MMRYDFSQLAVMAHAQARQLDGAVTWESMAIARIRNGDADLRDALLPRPAVFSAEDDLLSAIPTIIDRGFAFVQARDRLIQGIITAADLSERFVEFARPFLLIGEIERMIRQLVDRHFTATELAAADDGNGAGRAISRADDMTFGGYIRLLEDPGRWSRVELGVDRRTFIEALDQVRLIRNEVTHFSPDPLDDEDTVVLRNFLHWLQRIEPATTDQTSVPERR
jgi:hypothetical protein